MVILKAILAVSILVPLIAYISLPSPKMFSNCQDYYNSLNEKSLARDWCESGKYFNFVHNPKYKIFYRCSGERENPAIVMGHGWPTSSFDYQPLTSLLDPYFYTCTVDYLGYGFSDKPVDHKYSLFENADIIEQLVQTEGLKNFSYLTHDMGDSVGFIFIERYNKGGKPYTIDHHFFLNAGIYLPLTEFSWMQHLLLNDWIGPILQKVITANMLAQAMGTKVYTPPLSSQEVTELATTFDYQGGTHILHNTIEYQRQRMQY